MVVFQKTLESPLDSKEIQPSILKEISREWSLEGLMLKLKLQYFGHLKWIADSLEKTLMLGKIEGGRKSGQQRMRWLDGITDSMDVSLRNSGSWWWQGGLVCCSPCGFEELDTTEWLNCTELNWITQWSWGSILIIWLCTGGSDTHVHPWIYTVKQICGIYS